MSRYENKPLAVLPAVQVSLKDRDVVVKGAKGESTFRCPENTKVTQAAGVLKVEREDKNKSTGSLVGLTYRMLQNMIEGVTTGFQKDLDLTGVGYRMAMKGQILNLQLGFSHDINFEIPKGIQIELKPNHVTIRGTDKQLVGQVADKIRGFRPVEPYKGKGFKYSDEVVRRKAGKSGAK